MKAAEALDSSIFHGQVKKRPCADNFSGEGSRYSTHPLATRKHFKDG